MSTCFGIKKGTRLISKTNAYTVESISYVDNNFAVLALCRGKNGEMYHLKCIHQNCFHKYKQEAKVLFYLKDRFPDENKFVKIVEMFHYCNWFCFALEKLDTTLFDFVDNRKKKSLNIKDVRLIAQQMLSVLNMLKTAGITHTDVTAENIELVNKNFDVKLNGFRSAGRTSELSKMEIPIICGYSAPEVLLNCPLDESVDVWSLGCTLANLCFGSPLFPTFCDYEYMRMIVRVLGQPNQNLLDQGRCTQQFFIRDPDWRLKTPEEYKQDTGGKRHPSDSPHGYFESLDHLKENLCKTADPTDVEDIKSFVDLLKKMLMLDPNDRISPADALKHRFITRKRLSDTRNCVTKKRFEDSKNNTKGKFVLNEGTAIKYKSSVYRCEKVLGCGSFGVVANCRKLGTKLNVAVKMFKEKYYFEQEVKVLQVLRELDPQKNNIITFIDSFPYEDCFFIMSELLDLDLHAFMMKRDCKPLRVSEIRPIAQQMFSALRALKSIGITHLDIKPDNIMLENHDSQPFKIKLIDFGIACRTSTLSPFDVVQNKQYRAPEVYLGLPYDEGLDMWSVGCVLAFLVIGRDLFPPESKYEVLRVMIKLLGLPDKRSLAEGWRVQYFFKWSQIMSESSWTLKTQAEYTLDTQETVKKCLPHFDTSTSLEDLLREKSVKRNTSEMEDFTSFVDLLKKILTMNPADRILPDDALNHSFITMERFSGASSSRNITKKGFDDSINDTKGKFVLDEGAAIKYKSSVYRCEKVIGCGSFGVVAKFKNMGTKLNIAVKMFTKQDYFEKEVKVLQLLRDHDLQKHNIITFIDSFCFKDCFFVVSELLDLDLGNFMKRRDYRPLSVSEIRPIAQQMFSALRALKSIGIIHLDIKPGNIMLENHDSQPFKVKLTDFGMACKTETLSTFDVVQHKQYRAPEVYLGLPYDEGLDMWSVGCVLAFLLIGRDLFPPESKYEVLRVMIKLLGLPDKRSLAEGWRVPYFFKWSQTESETSWTLKTQAEYTLDTEETVKECLPHFDTSTSLENLLGIESVKQKTPEFEDLASFVDLLKKILTMNPADRILPDDALNHPFITMEHLPGASSSRYVTEAYQILAGSQMAKPASVTEVEDEDLTESSEEMKTSILTLDKGVKLIDKSSVYQVEEVLGSGSNGLVAKCRKVGTDETVAVKVFRKEKQLAAINEVNVHNHLSILDTNKNNLTTFIDCFIFEDCFCLVFELLHLNLCDFLQRQRWTPLRVAEIRPIAQQMLVSLKTLKSIGITHADMKPSSIMLVNHDSQPFKVKLIDFGMACRTQTLSEFKTVQAVGYRAPEVYMGLPYDESIDTWGLGCTLVYMYLAKHLFPEDEYKIMRLIVKCCGMPDKNALEKGKHSRHLFKQTKRGLNSYHWRLKTKKEYEEDTGKTIPPLHPFYEHLQSLDDLVTMTSDIETLANQEDIKAFVNLVKRMLVVNPADRILPDDALRHPFISMGEYPSSFSSCASEAHETQTGSNVTNPETVTEVENTDSVSDLTDSHEETETSTLTLRNGVKIIDESNVYIIEDVIGSESFGGVVRCRKKGTDDIVEIKIFRKEHHLKGIKEMNECSHLSNLDPSKTNMITFIDCFIYKDCFCLVYDPKK